MNISSNHDKTQRLTIGDVAPDFSLLDTANTLVSLSNFRGQEVIVYFYPAALTPGCTTEACDFTSNLAVFNNAKITILGISPDPVSKLIKFRDQEKITFPLLSDETKKTLHQWGAFGEKTLYGKTTTGVIRSTFLVNESGKIAHAWYNVRATGHVAKILRELNLLS